MAKAAEIPHELQASPRQREAKVLDHCDDAIAGLPLMAQERLTLCLQSLFRERVARLQAAEKAKA